MKSWNIIDIKKVTEEDGVLLVAEENNPIPFEVKRIFYVKNVIPGASRGNHATKKTKLILVPVAGSCKVHVDNGTIQEDILMDDDSKGLYIDEMVWRSMYDFSSDCVMLAICDQVFAPGDETYDDYKEFLLAIGK